MRRRRGLHLTLGSGQFIPGFEEQIVGHLDDEFDVNVEFRPSTMPRLAGKPAVIQVKLHEIKNRELPELDDEFAKDVGEFDSEELKADLLKARNSMQADNAVEDTLIKTVIENVG
ncbi:MAG: hypothetical protein ACLSAP_03470 [Oscillospiraceae bacterium]